MNTSDRLRAVNAARSSAATLGLPAADAVVLQDSNRLAVRLLPCDTLVRSAPLAHRMSAAFEVEVATQLAETESPIARLDPRVEARVHVAGDFAITFWKYYEPVSFGEPAPLDYAAALARLHAGMRQVELPVPHFTDRVGEARRLLEDPACSPELSDPDRQFLTGLLHESLSAVIRHGAAEQFLHGEPHPGNVLQTKEGLLFVDLETCCRGPVEFDLAGVPVAVAARYPRPNDALIRVCRTLALTLVAAWRWDRDDRFPDGRRMGEELIRQLRTGI